MNNQLKISLQNHYDVETQSAIVKELKLHQHEWIKTVIRLEQQNQHYQLTLDDCRRPSPS